jgi:hypothetical protein
MQRRILTAEKPFADRFAATLSLARCRLRYLLDRVCMARTSRTHKYTISLYKLNDTAALNIFQKAARRAKLNGFFNSQTARESARSTLPISCVELKANFYSSSGGLRFATPAISSSPHSFLHNRNAGGNQAVFKLRIRRSPRHKLKPFGDEAGVWNVNEGAFGGDV